MKRNDKLGKIWDVLYIETDLNEESLKVLAEKILEAIENDNEEKTSKK